MKKLLTSVVVTVLMLASCICAFSVKGVSDDPAESYEKKTAEYEDSDISLWFEPSFKKVLTSDTTPSGKDTYSVYMAKNEIESAQFVLYSDTDKTRLAAEITKFTNENGDTIPAKLYYEMYVNVDSVNPDSILGCDDSSSLIRSGETPDPVAPFSNVRTFKLNGGKSQAFFIRLQSSQSTPSGWYTATLNITDSNKNVIKTADVYAYVWDFVISEKTALQTAFHMNNTGPTYKKSYDYLLENRLCAMDIPMQGKIYMDPSNPYFTNERVSAIRVSDCGGGNDSKYTDVYPTAYKEYGVIYNRMKSSDIWDSVKDKLYFYTADEPLPVPDNHPRDNAQDVIERANTLRRYWDNPRIVVPVCEEHAYPNASYTQPLTSYTSRDLYDSTQAFMDNNSITVWCPRIYGFTPKYEIDAYGKYAGIENPAGWSDQIRTMSGPYSAAFSNAYYSYFNWEAVNGYYADRFNSYMSLANSAGKNVESWAYSAGWNKSYSYCNHLIENTGLQTKMMFWQLYQEDVTGYLYYGTNLWTENDKNNGNYIDTTKTGSQASTGWKTNKLPYANGYSIYGNGVLFYDGKQSGIVTLNGAVVGSLRVEIMRDGVEEYQMFTMLEELKGESAAKAIVSKVSKNVVNYLSMPNFNVAGKPDGIDDYDYMESVRRELGNAVEAASAAEKCEHTWDSGKTIKEPSCLEMGDTLYKCTKCGAEKTEIIPTLHTSGKSFEIVSGSPASCTADSTVVYRCKCGFEKRDRTKAFHSDPEHYTYKKRDDANHIIKCDNCGKQLDVEAHTILTRNTAATCDRDGEIANYCRFCEHTKTVETTEATGHDLVVSQRVEPTCTEDGYESLACANCSYTEETVIPALGHSYVDGVCTVCKEEETQPVPVVPGDVNGDGKINFKDSNMLKRIISHKYTPDEREFAAADMDGSNSINTRDSFLIKKLILGI